RHVAENLAWLRRFTLGLRNRGLEVRILPGVFFVNPAKI
ncbi:MAG: hypothetical protein ACI92S_001816, partial [Planctomycetaceae bacterium]